MQKAVLGHVAEALSHDLLGLHAGDVLAQQQHLAAPHDVLAEDCGRDLGAPRAYDAREAQDLARIYLKAHVVKAIARKVLHLQDGL